MRERQYNRYGEQRANPERSSKGRRREAADAATNDTARGPRTMVTTYLSLVDGLA